MQSTIMSTMDSSFVSFKQSYMWCTIIVIYWRSLVWNTVKASFKCNKRNLVSCFFVASPFHGLLRHFSFPWIAHAVSQQQRHEIQGWRFRPLSVIADIAEMVKFALLKMVDFNYLARWKGGRWVGKWTILCRPPCSRWEKLEGNRIVPYNRLIEVNCQDTIIFSSR